MSGSGSATDKSVSLGRAHSLPGPYLLEQKKKKEGKGSIQMGSKIALKKKKFLYFQLYSSAKLSESDVYTTCLYFLTFHLLLNSLQSSLPPGPCHFIETTLNSHQRLLSCQNYFSVYFPKTPTDYGFPEHL